MGAFGIRKPVWVCFWSFFLFYAGMGLYLNIWPNYLRRVGADPRGVGLIISFSLLLSTLSYLPGGYLADRFESRRVMQFAWWLAVPAPLFFAWARNWAALLPGVILFYFSSFGLPGFLAYLSQVCDSGDFSVSLGFTFNFSAIGMVLTPALGGFLVRRFSFEVLFYVVTACYFLSALVMHLLKPLPEEAHAASVPKTGARIPRELWLFTVPVCLLFGAMNIFPPSISQYLEDVRHLSLVVIGTLGSAGSLGSALLPPLLGWLAARVGIRRSMAAGILFACGAAFLFLAGPGLIWLAAAFFLRGALDALRTLSVTAAGEKTAGTKKGAVFGYFNFISGLATSAGPVLGGLLYARSPDLPFIAALFLLPVAGLILMGQLPRHRQG